MPCSFYKTRVGNTVKSFAKSSYTTSLFWPLSRDWSILCTNLGSCVIVNPLNSTTRDGASSSQISLSKERIVLFAVNMAAGEIFFLISFCVKLPPRRYFILCLRKRHINTAPNIFLLIVVNVIYWVLTWRKLSFLTFPQFPFIFVAFLHYLLNLTLSSSIS